MNDTENIYTCPRCDFTTTDKDAWDEHLTENFGYSGSNPTVNGSE